MKSHYESCKDCKKRFVEMLTKIFDRVETNYDLKLSTRVDDYKKTNVYETLKKIYQALCDFRGFKSIVNSKKLAKADFFIPEKGFIIEFDESQHFTKPRAIALQHYPKNKRFGFSVDRWRLLCEKLDRKDNDPLYRDEQRAWYDTLKDFAPILLKKGKIVRLYSRDFVWCSLSPERQTDLLTIKKLIEGRSSEQ